MESQTESSLRIELYTPDASGRYYLYMFGRETFRNRKLVYA